MLDNFFLLQYHAKDSQGRLVDVDLSNRGDSIRVGGLAIVIKFLWRLEFANYVVLVNSTLVLVLYALKLKRVRLISTR